jgi:hypothetical protein
MRRRDVLRTLGVTAAVGTVPAAGARSPSTTQEEFGPVGSLGVRGAKETVVSGDGTVAYLAVTDGFATVDLADPAAPEVLAERRGLLPDRENGPLEDVFDCKVDGDLMAIAGPANGKREALEAAVVYDVSDPADPEQLTVVETDFFHHNLDVADGVLYLCANDGQRNPLVTVDARTGERLGEWSVVSQDDGWQNLQFGLWPLHDVSVHDGVAYLAYWDAGTWLVDVSDPANPSVITRVRGRDPSAFAGLPREELVNEITAPPGNDHFVTVDESGDLLGISVESWAVETETEDGETRLEGGPGAIYLYDVSDPANARELSVVEPPESDDPTFTGTWTTSHNFELADGRLYSSWYAGGVRLFDVSDPADPDLLGAWRHSEETSFWTAQQGVVDEFFVATSRRDPSLDDPQSGATLYTFPDGTEPMGSTVVSGSGGGTSPETTPTDTAVTPTPTDAPTATTTETGTGTPTDGSGPGFGVLAALGGFGVATWRLATGDDD